MRILTLRLPHRLKWLIWLLPLLSLVELWPDNIIYQNFNWDRPPEVYQQLSARNDEGVVLELPSFDEHIDSTYMLWALKHGKPIVNGVSGFYPPHIQKLATLTRSLPNRPSTEALERIHGLRYLVIHLDRISDPALAEQWLTLSQKPPNGLDFSGRYDDALLFTLNRSPETAWRWRRLIPSVTARAHSQLHFEIEAAEPTNEEKKQAIRQVVQVSLNKESIDNIELKNGINTIVTSVPELASSVHPVALELLQNYSIVNDTAGDARYLLGQTNEYSPVDIVVESASRQHGSFVTIWVNGINHAARQPGYNVVLLDAVSGERVGRAAFDVSKHTQQNQAMEKYIRAAPRGSIVIIALKDRGIAELDSSSTSIFSMIGGGKLDISSQPADGSHLIIGIRGAAPGSAIEIAKNDKVHFTVGVDRRALGMKVRKFSLGDKP